MIVVEPFYAGTLAGLVSEALRDRLTRLHSSACPAR